MRKFLAEDTGPFDERSINEMAEWKTSQFLVVIRGKEHNPPHAHLITNKGKLVCKFLIEGTAPTKSSEFRFVRGFEPIENQHLLSDVVKWFGGSTDGFNNWRSLFFTWNRLNPK